MPFKEAVIDPQQESLQHHKGLCNRMLDAARALSEALRVPTAFPDNFAESPQPAPLLQVGMRHRDLVFLPPEPEQPAPTSCPFPWHFVGMDADGNVFPCGWWFDIPVGNIRTQSFKEIWRDGYHKVRAEHLCGALRPTCVNCPTAGRGNVNNRSAFSVL